MAGILLIYLIQPIAEITAAEWLPALIPPLLAHWSAWRGGYTCVEWLSAGYWVLASTVWLRPLGAGRVWLLHFYPGIRFIHPGALRHYRLSACIAAATGVGLQKAEQNAENKKRVGFLAWGMLLLIPFVLCRELGVCYGTIDAG
ncbi:MAG: hypothetical protein M9928_17820 [Anaerolineae bacterium]|nr:hypothetical protein [Anaerolineae bacterium]